MKTINVLCTDFGDFPVPSEIKEVLARCKFRKDHQPDRRTKAGKEWAAAWAAFCKQKEREHLNA